MRKEAEEESMEARALRWKEDMEEAARRSKEDMDKAAMEAKAKRKAKAKAMEAMEAKAKGEEAWKAGVSVTEAGRREESVTEAGKAEEAVTVGSSKSADEVMGKETLQQLLKGMPNKFAILDPDGDDEKDEIDRGKSDVEDEHMPSNGKNPSDRGEESVTVGSGKSAMGQAVISPETEESLAEAVKEAEEGALLVGMDITGGEPSMRKDESGKRSEMVGMRSEMPWVAEEPTGTLLFMREHDRLMEAKEEAKNKQEEEEREMRKRSEKHAENSKISQLPRHAEERQRMQRNRALLDRNEKFLKSVAEAKARASARDEEAGKAEVSVTEAAILLKMATRLSEDIESEEAATQRALLTSNSKLAKKWKKKQTKARDEEAGKAEESVTEVGKAEESVTVASAKSAIDKEMISQEMSVTEAEVAGKEAEEVPLLIGLNSKGGESSMRKEAEEKSVKGSDMQRHAEEPTAPVPDYYSRMTPEYREKLMKLNKVRAAEREALLARFEKLTQSKRSVNSAGGDSCTLKNKPAVPSATRSMGQYSVQDDLDHDRGKSATALVKKTAAEEEMAEEAEKFATYRTLWESKWRKTCGLFSETTVLSSMQFTHYTPGRTPRSSSCSTPEILQIFSIKLTGLDGGLEFPLSVYGVVAIRDIVDRNRNILFSRDISDRQELTQNDPFLHLIGPSRAIVFTDKVCIEIQLRVVAGSQDKALISCARRYAGGNGPGVSTICFKNVFCTLELSSEPVKQTVQATILGVQVLDYNGSWPLEYGGLVACSPLSGEVVITDGRFSRNIDPLSSPIVLIDSKHEAMPKGNGGFVHLWRQVVSVELQGGLDVVIKGYSKSGAVAAEASVRFLPKVCNISQKRCLLGDAEVTITVAWSLVATSKIGVALESCARRCF